MTWQDAARRQHGIITVPQLLDCGLTYDRIDGLRARGHLLSAGRRGVLCARASPDSPMRAAWMAALATGGVLSHLSAARLWRMELPQSAVAEPGRGVPHRVATRDRPGPHSARRPAVTGAPVPLSVGARAGADPPGRPSARARADDVHVTVAPERRVMPVDGVRIHRVPLLAADLARLSGLPITRPRRTALDCLVILPEHVAVTALDRWLQISLLSIEDVARRIEEHPRRHGTPRLRRLLRACAAGEAESERLLHRLLRQAGITGWRANARIGGYRADVAFDRERVAIEVDGFAFHVTPERFQGDRTRQNALVNAGWSVLRFTWRDLSTRPDDAVRTISAALAAARIGAGGNA